MKNETTKIVEATGTISGAASILGSWQVCHNICLGLIALLSVIGITITGMPLFFLTKVAVPIWIIAVLLLGVTLYFYIMRKCISKALILLNSGLLIAGIPFQPVQIYILFFWVVGGVIALTGIILFISEKIHKNRCEHEN